MNVLEAFVDHLMDDVRGYIKSRKPTVEFYLSESKDTEAAPSVDLTTAVAAVSTFPTLTYYKLKAGYLLEYLGQTNYKLTSQKYEAAVNFSKSFNEELFKPTKNLVNEDVCKHKIVALIALLAAQSSKAVSSRTKADGYDGEYDAILNVAKNCLEWLIDSESGVLPTLCTVLLFEKLAAESKTREDIEGSFNTKLRVLQSDLVVYLFRLMRDAYVDAARAAEADLGYTRKLPGYAAAEKIINMMKKSIQSINALNKIPDPKDKIELTISEVESLLRNLELYQAELTKLTVTNEFISRAISNLTEHLENAVKTKNEMLRTRVATPAV